MSLLDTINQDLKAAMKSGDEAQKRTLRSIKAAITRAQKDKNNQPLDDDEIIAVIRKQARQREDSIEAYAAAGRTDLADAERAELAILERYLPALMDQDTIREHARRVIAEVGASSMRDMGAVMGRLMAELKGKADGRVVNQVVRELLSGR
ncbi:MAG: GatB/YqeY domain-containing protein [Caldilineae bacterium]|nr:MAG: GatB/YqeY domain-containing protein [Caldilineae bacterium]